MKEEIRVKESNFDLENGFAWIVVLDEKDNEYTIQACLKTLQIDDDYHTLEVKKEITRKDCGMDWGVCGEINGVAFDKFGKEECKEMLFSEMIKLGINII